MGSLFAKNSSQVIVALEVGHGRIRIPAWVRSRETIGLSPNASAHSGGIGMRRPGSMLASWDMRHLIRISVALRSTRRLARRQPTEDYTTPAPNLHHPARRPRWARASRTLDYSRR